MPFPICAGDFLISFSTCDCSPLCLQQEVAVAAEAIKLVWLSARLIRNLASKGRGRNNHHE